MGREWACGEMADTFIKADKQQSQQITRIYYISTIVMLMIGNPILNCLTAMSAAVAERLLLLPVAAKQLLEFPQEKEMFVLFPQVKPHSSQWGSSAHCWLLCWW